MALAHIRRAHKYVQHFVHRTTAYIPFPFTYKKNLINHQYVTGMGMRCKSSRPRRDRDAYLPRPRRWLHQPRRDRDFTLKFRDETETRRL